MRSAKRRQLLPRLAVVACAVSLLGGVLAGCSTTQEKAAAQQAESRRILDARAARQAQRKKMQEKRKSTDGKGVKPQKDGGKKR